MKSLVRIAFASVFGVALAACGSSDAPEKQFAESEAAVRAASEVGADHDPQASLHMKLAKDRIAKATKANEEGEHEVAKKLLEQAELDAELALSLTREKQAQTQAAQAKQQLETLPQ